MSSGIGIIYDGRVSSQTDLIYNLCTKFVSMTLIKSIVGCLTYDRGDYITLNPLGCHSAGWYSSPFFQLFDGQTFKIPTL